VKPKQALRRKNEGHPGTKLRLMLALLCWSASLLLGEPVTLFAACARLITVKV
jgi:hypothetical protein